MSKPWFVRHAGKVHGPFDDAQVQALVSAGKINPATEVANSSAGPWHKAAGVLRHFASPHMHGGHPPSTVSAPSVSPQSTVIGSGNHQHSRVPPPPLKPAISPMRDSGKPARAPQSHPPDSGLALPTILSRLPDTLRRNQNHCGRRLSAALAVLWGFAFCSTTFRLFFTKGIYGLMQPR
jgi:hypothetical protein